MYILVLLIKETGLCLPILIGGYYFLYQFKNIKQSWQNKKNLFFILLLIVITLNYILYKNLYFEGIERGNLRPISSNIFIQCWTNIFYLKLFLWPNNLNLLHYTPPLTSPFQRETLLPLLGTIGMFISIFLLRKKMYLVSVGLFWYITGLLPKFYATLRVPAAEHHFYLPSIGIYIVLFSIFTKMYINNKKLILYIVISLILLLSLLTYERSYYFTLPKYLWEKGIKNEPKHPGNWINLAIIYQKEGKLRKAKEIIKKAQKIFNKDRGILINLYINLSNIYFDEGEYNKALKILTNTIYLHPSKEKLWKIYFALGRIYETIGRKDEAIKYWKKLLELNSFDWKAYQNIAKIFIEENNLESSKSYIKKAIELNPKDFYSYFLLGKVIEEEGDLRKAMELYIKSIQLKPDWFYSHYTLALLYMKTKNPFFKDELEKSIILNPKFKPALYLYKSLFKK
jgi:tetratricopeptide (TPR) repeat protein